jgi:hypothetical protein
MANDDITGVWSPLASITLVRTVSFSIYQKSKYFLDDWIYQATGSSPLVIANTKDALPTLSTITCFGLSGAMAGATITTIACPFELTKLSAQISVLMADRKDGSTNDAVRKSYQNLGTIRTAQNLVRHRGWMGLYSGFHLHLRMFNPVRDGVGAKLLTLHSPRYDRHRYLLRHVREYKAAPSKRSRWLTHNSFGCGYRWWHVWAG